MSTLTTKERDGLEDVFLSIHSNNKRYKKITESSSSIFSYSNSFSMPKLLLQAKESLKQSKISRFLVYLSKKKKKLSK